MTNKKYKIFLVEDERVDQIAFQKMIDSKNISCDLTIVESVTEAKEVLELNKFDIIILDYMLEGGTAFDLLENIHNSAVIVYTGAGDEEIAVKAMKLGAYDYIVKDRNRNYLKILPFTIERVIKQKEADQSLKELTNLHKAILDNSFNSFVVVNYDGHIVFANMAFIKISKCSMNELINSNLAEIILGEEFISHILDSVKEGQSLKDLKTMLRPKTGSDIPVAISVIPIIGQNNILFCFRDLRIDKTIREGIKHFQRFAADHIKVSLFKLG
ncbi:MAG: response regulator, partial [Candidatus Hodarchaeota archaeon]